jgi:NADP-dependent 3-hydroxy acid dehydrogenase YdfG
MVKDLESVGVTGASGASGALPQEEFARAGAALVLAARAVEAPRCCHGKMSLARCARRLRWPLT